MSGDGAWALDVAANVQVTYGYEQVRAGVVVLGDCGAGLEFEFAGADRVFYEEDLLGASGESFEGAVFIPLEISIRSGVAEVFVVQDFDGQVAEYLVGLIAGYVGEAGGGEVRFAVLESDGYRWFVLYCVYYRGGA